MTKTTRNSIEVQGVPIAILTERNEDFISLTDMLKAKDGTSSSPTGCATATR